MTKECRRHESQALGASQPGVSRSDTWVGGSVRNLKISLKPDQAAQRKLYWLRAGQTWSLFTWNIAHMLHDCNMGRVYLCVFFSPFGWFSNALKSTISFRARLLIKEIPWNRRYWACIWTCIGTMLLHCKFSSCRRLQYFTAFAQSFENSQLFSNRCFWNQHRRLSQHKSLKIATLQYVANTCNSQSCKDSSTI